MAILNIAHMGNPILRQAAQPVPPKEIRARWVRSLIDDLWETMGEYGGVGLAAPQVHRSVRIVVVGFESDANPRYPDRESVPRMALINPVLKPLTKELSGMYEGCLSLPGLRGWVERPNLIKVKALDEKGEAIEFDAEGFAAVVLQHECDHLDGKLYVDRMKDMTRFFFDREYDRYALASPEEDGDPDD